MDIPECPLRVPKDQDASAEEAAPGAEVSYSVGLKAASGSASAILPVWASRNAAVQSPRSGDGEARRGWDIALGAALRHDVGTRRVRPRPAVTGRHWWRGVRNPDHPLDTFPSVGGARD